MAYKECTKCQEVKPFTHFTINGNRRRSDCRECERDRAKMKKRASRERLREVRLPDPPLGPCPLASAFNQWRAPATLAMW